MWPVAVSGTVIASQGAQNCRVMATAEVAADLFQRQVRKPPRDNGDGMHPHFYDRALSARPGKVCARQSVLFSDAVDYGLGSRL